MFVGLKHSSGQHLFLKYYIECQHERTPFAENLEFALEWWKPEILFSTRTSLFVFFRIKARMHNKENILSSTTNEWQTTTHNNAMVHKMAFVLDQKRIHLRCDTGTVPFCDDWMCCNDWPLEHMDTVWFRTTQKSPWSLQMWIFGQCARRFSQLSTQLFEDNASNARLIAAHCAGIFLGFRHKERQEKHRNNRRTKETFENASEVCFVVCDKTETDMNGDESKPEHSLSLLLRGGVSHTTSTSNYRHGYEYQDTMAPFLEHIVHWLPA